MAPGENNPPRSTSRGASSQSASSQIGHVIERDGTLYVTNGTVGEPGYSELPLDLRAPSLEAPLGQETDSLRGAFGRSLDRMARVMMDADRYGRGASFKDTGTPHLALTVIDGVVHVAGNSGMGPGKIKDATDRLANLATPEGQEGRNHDLAKLRAIRDGNYRSKDFVGFDDHSRGFDAVREALKETNKIKWLPNVKGKGEGCLHGEMDLLNEVQKRMQAEFDEAVKKAKEAEEAQKKKEAEEAEKEGSEETKEEETKEAEAKEEDATDAEQKEDSEGSDSGTSRGGSGRTAEEKGKARADELGLTPWPIGGRKRDCMACHWAHAIFNEHIAKGLGFVVVTGGTHGKIFNGWAAPDCIKEHPKAMAALEAKITGTEVPTKEGGKKLDFVNGVIVAPQGYTPAQGAHDEPYISDSEPGSEPEAEHDSESKDGDKPSGSDRNENADQAATEQSSSSSSSAQTTTSEQAPATPQTTIAGGPGSSSAGGGSQTPGRGRGRGQGVWKRGNSRGGRGQSSDRNTG